MEYHNDGTVRMDYYTFQKLSVDKIMRSIKRRAVPSYRGRKTKVREFK